MVSMERQTHLRGDGSMLDADDGNCWMYDSLSNANSSLTVPRCLCNQIRVEPKSKVKNVVRGLPFLVIFHVHRFV
jgi:hypothetical protein